MWNKLLTWLRTAYSEADGNGSSTRIAILMVIVTVLGITIDCCWLVNAKHITIEQFDAYLIAAGTFTTVLTGTLYGINKVGSAGDNLTKSQSSKVLSNL